MGKDLKGKELGKGIVQRKNGTYMGRFTDKYGKRHTVYNANYSTLKRLLEKEKYEVNHIFTQGGDSITLSAWFEDFLVLYKYGRVKETTIHRIKQTFNNCRKDVIGSMILRDIRAVHIQTLINELDEKGFSHGTLKLIKSLLNELFRTAIGNGYLVVNPCDAVILPLPKLTEARYLTECEQENFLECAKEYQHYDIFCANLTCGLRIGELLGLKWSDVDFENKTIKVERTLHYDRLKDDEKSHFFFTTPKTATSARIIPLLPETEKVFKKVRKQQLLFKLQAGMRWEQETPFEDMIFTSQYGAPVRHGDVNRTIKLVVKKVNLLEVEIAKYEDREPMLLKSFSPHCFRHTFVTRCKQNGVPYATIKPYVGHSKESTTMYYDHNKPQIDVEKLEKIHFLSAM